MINSLTKNELKYFNNYISTILSSNNIYNFADKSTAVNIQIAYMLSRTNNMFKWKNLPETIPERILEQFLQTNGNVCFTQINDNLYIFTGGLGGAPDVYYKPTLYTISSPALQISKTLEIGKECIVIPNDSFYIGLLPLFSRYATAIAENEISLNVALINTRIVSLISASDDRTKASAEKCLEDISNGKLSVIAESEFLEGVKTSPFSTTSTNTLKNLIETEQYLKATWFNEIGLNANYNMKRENLNTAETEMSNDILLPLVDDMLKVRQDSATKINDLYGTSISVELNSAWENVHNETTETPETPETTESEENNDTNSNA